MDDTSLLNIAMAMLGVAAIVWAYTNRQFSRTEAAASEPLNDAEVIHATSSLPPARRVTVVILVALVFASLLWSIAFTVITSNNAAKAHTSIRIRTSDGVSN